MVPAINGINLPSFFSTSSLSSLPSLPPRTFSPFFVFNDHLHNNPLSFSTSAAQSLINPQISPLFQSTHLPFSLSNSPEPFFSSDDANFLHHKCLELLRLSELYSDVELVRAVHSLILKLGEDNYLLNSLITAYLKLGSLSFAYKVFVRISSPDVVSYTAIISGFAKCGYEFEAVRMFMRTRERGIEPNEFTFVAILTACTRINKLQLGVQIHSLIVKLGYVFSTYVANALMALYSKCGLLDDALQVFDEMSERDVASWNTIISSVVGEMMYDKGFELFREMQRIDGFRANQFTLSSILSASAGCFAGILGREIHARALKMGFENSLSVNNALIGFYTKCGSAEDVQVVFERMPIKDVISWTCMITAYMEFGMVDLALETFDTMPVRNCVSFNAVLAGLCANGEGLKALSLFSEIINKGVELTESTLTSVIKACGLLEEKNISEQIHGFVIKFGSRSNACIEAALLDMCTRCGRMTDAQKMFHESLYDRSLPIKWTSLISGYARNAQLEEAMSLFKWGHSEEAFEVDEVVTTTIVGICGALGFYEMGKQMHCFALKLGHQYDVELGNAIISMYSKCGYIEDAKKVFNLLPVLDVVTWNCLISGYLLLRQGDEVLAVWARMKKAHIRPDSITLILVISSYRHTKSNMLDDCRRLFFSMSKEYDIEPTSDHYASFVSVLGDWGSLEEAEDLISKMPFDPKIAVWRSLLHSCNVHAESMMGKRIVKRILAMEPEDISTFILVSNLFSASGRWHCSDMVREEMRRKGLRKHPARSWIVHQNAIHSFYTRDRTHSRSKDIYRGLEILIVECLKAGYVPDTSFVLHEVEEQQKKDFLFYHSAKLAVTYGLLTTKPGRPIRVMKNVLLCGDCHNFVTYVSRITRREICVRDTSGFHSFCNGNCSCKDHCWNGILFRVRTLKSLSDEDVWGFPEAHQAGKDEGAPLRPAQGMKSPLRPLKRASNSSNSNGESIAVIAGEKPKPRYNHAATVVGNKMVVVGGECADGMLDDVQVLSFDQFSWSSVSSKLYLSPTSLPLKIPSCRGHSLVSCGKKALLIGGKTVPGSEKVSVWVFDTETECWSLMEAKGDVPVARSGHTVVKSSSVLILFGGEDSKRRKLNDLHMFDLKSMTWLPLQCTGTGPSPRSNHVAALYDDRILYIFGGSSKSKTFDDLYSLDFETMMWSRIKIRGFHPSPRAGCCGVLCGTKWYITGGGSRKKRHLETLVFDVVKVDWSVVTLSPPSSVTTNKGFSLVLIQHKERDFLVAFGGSRKEPSNQVEVLILEKNGNSSGRRLAPNKNPGQLPSHKHSLSNEFGSQLQGASSCPVDSLRQNLASIVEEHGSSRRSLSESVLADSTNATGSVSLRKQFNNEEITRKLPQSSDDENSFSQFLEQRKPPETACLGETSGTYIMEDLPSLSESGNLSVPSSVSEKFPLDNEKMIYPESDEKCGPFSAPSNIYQLYETKIAALIKKNGMLEGQLAAALLSRKAAEKNLSSIQKSRQEAEKKLADTAKEMELLKEKLAGMELAQEEANNLSNIVHSDNVRLEHDVAFLKAVLDDTQKELHSTRGMVANERARAFQLQVEVFHLKQRLQSLENRTPTPRKSYQV